MVERSFTKLFSSITESSLWVMQPHAVRIVWITLLAMADRDGVVHSSVPGLAARARVDLAEVETALEVFRQPDAYSRTKDYDGRRLVDVAGGWMLLTYAQHRATRDLESEREAKRRWAREHRSSATASEPSAAVASSDESTFSKVEPRRLWTSASASLSGSDLDREGVQGEPDAAFEIVVHSNVGDGGSPEQHDVMRTRILESNRRERARYVEREPRILAESAAAVASAGEPAAVEAQTQRAVYRSLDGWEPPPEVYARAAEIGLSRERVDERLAQLRLGPIGGQRGVFDRTRYVLTQLPKWRSWSETEAAKANAGPGLASGGAFGARRGGVTLWAPNARHVAFARKYGLDLPGLADAFIRSGEPADRGIKDADDAFGKRLSKAKAELQGAA